MPRFTFSLFHTLSILSAPLHSASRLLNQLIPRHLRGVALALISTALFVVVGILVRLISDQIDLFQILFFRQLVFILLLLPLICRSIDILRKPTHVRLHMLRVTGAFLALYLGFVTVSNIPLADATALGFTQVLFVLLAARVFLGEGVSLSRLLTVLLGFAGVMLVVQPQFAQQSLLYTLCGLVGAAGAATAVLCVRLISQHEPRVTLLTYQAVFVGLIAAVPAVLNWQWPDAEQLIVLVAIGAISSIAQTVGVSAYKHSEANLVANVEYAKIIYSVGFGYWLFDEVPNELAWVGIGLILLSPVLPLIPARGMRQQRKKPTV